MIYETKCSFIKVDDNGNDKVIKERYLIAEAESFGDAEEQTYDFCDGETGLDVIDVKRSKIKEIANERTSDDEKIFLATLVDIFHNDDGSEKEMKYTIAFYSKDMNSAHTYISQYASQGYNMSVTKIVESKFVDVLK